MAKDQPKSEVSRLPNAEPTPAAPVNETSAMLASQQTFRVMLKGGSPDRPIYMRSRKVDALGRVYYADHLDVAALSAGDARIVFERYNGITSTQSSWVVEARPGEPAEVWVDGNEIKTAWDGAVEALRAQRQAEKAAKRGQPITPQSVQRTVEQHVAAAMTR